MRIVKRGFLIVVVMLFAIMFCFNVNAVGIVGGDLNVFVDYEPGLVQQIDYNIMITNPDIEEYETFATGNLAKYISVEPRFISGDSSDLSFQATLQLPVNEKELSAGKICGDVGVVEKVSEDTGGGVNIVTRTSAKARVCVRVLYEGKHVEAKLKIGSVNEGEILKPVVEVTNWGRENISSVNAEVFLYDTNGTEVGKTNTGSVSLGSKEEGRLESSFSTGNIGPGEFYGKAIVYYDGESTETGEAFFRIGTLFVEVIEYSKRIFAGRINEFNIELLSKWNKELENVYARIIIEDQDVKTMPAKLGAWATLRTKGYVDATSFELGEMPVRIMVFYADSKTVFDGVVEVVEDPDKDKFKWFEDGNLTLILLVILIILLELGAMSKKWFPKKRKRK